MIYKEKVERKREIKEGNETGKRKTAAHKLEIERHMLIRKVMIVINIEVSTLTLTDIV